MSQSNSFIPHESTTQQHLVNKVAEDIADEVIKAVDKFTRDEVIRIVKELLLSDDIRLIQNSHGGTYKLSVLYVPYMGMEDLRAEHDRYRDAVNSIINEDQRAMLAQKLREE